MSTSKQTFDQVKNILGKLDRNIEDARARRLRATAPAPLPALAPSGVPVLAPTALIGGDSTAMPTAAPLNGVARPLRAMPKQATPAFRYPDSR